MSGAEAIRIAFRLGIRVSEVSQNLEPVDEEDDSPDSWAYVVNDILPEEAQKELDDRQAKDVSYFLI
jgi:monodictyphenone polyketide synthase